MFDHDMLYDVERELLTKLSIKKEERKIFVDELVHSIKYKMTFFSSLINLIQRKCSFFARGFFPRRNRMKTYSISTIAISR